MAGLGRTQQRFGIAALFGTLAALFTSSRKSSALDKFNTASGGYGHPLLKKYLHRNPTNKGEPGYDYPGYGHRPGKGATLLPFGTSTKPAQWRTK